MLTLTLYKNLSPVNKIGKELSDSQNIFFVFKDDSSILNPVLKIKSSLDIGLYNYLYIPELQRYYFINDIRILNDNLWEIYAHVDVLETYKNSILSNTGVVRRQSELFNTYLNDPEWKVYAYESIYTFKMPTNGFTKNLNFILTVAGA